MTNERSDTRLNGWLDSRKMSNPHLSYFRYRYIVDSETPTTSRISANDMQPLRIRLACVIFASESTAAGRPGGRAECARESDCVRTPPVPRKLR